MFAVVFAALLVGFVGYLVSLQFTVRASVSGRLCTGVISLIVLLMVGSFLWYGLQRFQVDVDRDGWTVRIGRYRRDLRWAEISAVVIENREIEGRGHRRTVPALYLVPDSGVSLDVPSDLRATVDGRPAVRLFDLADPKIEEKQFVSDLAGLAGDRLEVRVHRLNVMLLSEDARQRLNGGRALPAFPPGAEGVRTQRWLNRRRFLLFVGWYLFAVVPALLLTGVTARLHELLGAAVAVLGLFAVVAAYAQFVTLFSHAIDLVDAEVAIAGTELVRVIGDRTDRDDMHGGKVVVLPPGAKRGYGKAWLLGFPHAVALLGDPRTGRLRHHDDLRALSAVLRESPHATDRAAARDIDSLAVQSQVGDPTEPDGAENARLWISLTKAGRILAWAVVVGSVLLAGGWMLESTHYLGGAVILICVPLATVWALYALYRILSLLGAAWQAVRKNH
ncbi:hypothetical protein C1I95_02705 [Micromonospora craterilacus]|uniref:PH domain-containing protein n=1 Tax=Micromonospora craterilacus TaxID=1655439 RepID=A0A2W2FPM5_9ACTN|nr:hypothetical protein C1I95_02705 [Micromonospora craterilacus]